MATYLTRNQTNGNQDKWTFSSWVKKSTSSAAQCIFATSNGSTTSFDAKFNSSDSIDVYNYLGGGYGARLVTNRVFRDPASWYHIVIVYDSGNSTEAQRLRIYVNGTEETSFGTTNYPSLNENSDLNVSGSTIDIGRQQNGSQFFLGYLAQSILADGQAYAPTVFGSTNADGIWVPITSPSVTYGTNGFKLDYKDSGASAAASNFGADTSGNNNHFTSNSLGTNPNTNDSPQNIFATLDPNNDRTQGGFTFSKGNTKVVTSGSNKNYACLTQAFKTGKWYMECRYTAGSSDGNVGFCDMNDLQMTNTSSLGSLSNEARVTSAGAYKKNNSTTSGWAGSFTDNDILGLCLDCDNNRFTISKNGQFADGSGNYDEANPTAYITYTTGNFMTFAFGEGSSSSTATIEINTGNSPYTIASGNADANGYGSFEYAVPSGYYALCTKNMATYG